MALDDPVLSDLSSEISSESATIVLGLSDLTSPQIGARHGNFCVKQ